MNRLLITTSKTAASSLSRNHRSANPLSSRSFSSVASGGDGDVEVKVGTVTRFYMAEGFGFILPDGVDKKDHDNSDLFFIHKNNIRASKDKYGRKIIPNGLTNGQRVKFKAGDPDEGKDSGKAFDLTYEDGKLVPPFTPQYLKGYMTKEKNQFGDELYEIFNSTENEKDMEVKVVQAYQKVKSRIEGKQAEVKRTADKTEYEYENFDLKYQLTGIRD